MIQQAGTAWSVICNVNLNLHKQMNKICYFLLTTIGKFVQIMYYKLYFLYMYIQYATA